MNGYNNKGKGVSYMEGKAKRRCGGLDAGLRKQAVESNGKTR